MKLLRGKVEKSFESVDGVIHYDLHGILHFLFNIHNSNHLSNVHRVCVSESVSSRGEMS